MRAAVQTDKLPPGKGELHRQRVAFLAARKIGRRSMNTVDGRIRQQRHVEPAGLLGLAVEPQTGCDLRHDILPHDLRWPIRTNWASRGKDLLCSSKIRAKPP